MKVGSRIDHDTGVVIIPNDFREIMDRQPPITLEADDHDWPGTRRDLERVDVSMASQMIASSVQLNQTVIARQEVPFCRCAKVQRCSCSYLWNISRLGTSAQWFWPISGRLIVLAFPQGDHAKLSSSNTGAKLSIPAMVVGSSPI